MGNSFLHVSSSGNFWPLGDAEDSGEDRRLQGGCAQLPRGVFGSLSLWKSGIPDVKNDDLTLNNGVISPINTRDFSDLQSGLVLEKFWF